MTGANWNRKIDSACQWLLAKASSSRNWFARGDDHETNSPLRSRRRGAGSGGVLCGAISNGAGSSAGNLGAGRGAALPGKPGLREQVARLEPVAGKANMAGRRQLCRVFAIDALPSANRRVEGVRRSG